MVYNLLNKATITTAGGNKSLLASEIDVLRDYNTSSGISLFSSDVLYLNIDLGDRYPVSDIKIYTSTTSTSGISVSYKENVGDSYTSLTLSSGSGYIYTIQDAYFNPRYLQCMFSDVELTLYEVSTLSSLYDVSFGTTGDQSVLDIGDVDTTYESNFTTELPIYNSSTDTRDVYLYVDYSVDNLHNRLTLSNTTSSGTFYNTYHTSFNYVHGNYGSNLNVSNKAMSLVDPGETFIPDYNLSATYLSPILILDDEYYVSNVDLVTREDANSSVTLYAKSSNTKPLNYYELFVAAEPGNLHKYNMYTQERAYLIAGGQHRESILVNKEGDIFSFGNSIKSFDRIGNTNYLLASSVVYADYKAEWCSNSELAWAYDIGTGTLTCVSLGKLSCSIVYSKTSSYTGITSFVRDFSTSRGDLNDVWYIDDVLSTILCIDYQGEEIARFNVNTRPAILCATDDDYCWVVAESGTGETRLLKLGLDYTVENFYLPVSYVGVMSFDPTTGGIFFTSGLSLYRFDGETTTLIGSYPNIDSIDYIEEKNHLIISSRTNNLLSVVNPDTGEVTIRFNMLSSDSITTAPKVFYSDVLTGQLPIGEDLFWSSNNNDNWYILDKEGGQLKKYKYHQFKLVLTTNDFYSNPKAYTIKYSKPLIKRVSPEDTTSFYLSYTDISDMDYKDYSTTLTAHWENANE